MRKLQWHKPPELPTDETKAVIVVWDTRVCQYQPEQWVDQPITWGPCKKWAYDEPIDVSDPPVPLPCPVCGREPECYEGQISDYFEFECVDEKYSREFIHKYVNAPNLATAIDWWNAGRQA